MDNAYYTGATLIRAGHNGGGNSKYLNNNHNNSSSPPLTPCQINVSTSLAGPPLLIQPNLLAGLPLIRNGQHQHHGHGHGGTTNHHNLANVNVPPSPGHTHTHNGGLVGITSSPGPGPPPGVICCFQPVYYIPTTGSPPSVYGNSQILVNNNNLGKHNGNGNNIKLHPVPKRKNYKNLNNSGHTKVNRTPPPLLDSQVQFNRHQKLTSSSSYPDPISPPGKQVKTSHHQPVTRTLSSNYFSKTTNTSVVLENLSPLDNNSKNEERERSESLMNYYFYDKHWRPRDDGDSSNPGDSDESDSNHGWKNASQQLKSFSENLNLIKSDNETNGIEQSEQVQESESYLENFSTSVYGQQKDLEVEAQIITLANGHRDLEIRLCYVTS